jgi:exodeoxyribonuclease VII large subunit
VARIDGEDRALATLRDRPALAEPWRDIDRRAAEVTALLARTHRCASAAVETAMADITHTTARVRALSPAATLDRGYAVVQRGDDSVVRDAASVQVNESLEVRLAAGRLTVGVTATKP